jgi:hypothetical protein
MTRRYPLLPPDRRREKAFVALDPPIRAAKLWRSR